MSKAEDIIDEVKEFAKNFYEKNGNTRLRIPNKDFNIWIVNELIDIRGRISIMELKTKMVMWFFGIIITLIALFQII